MDESSSVSSSRKSAEAELQCALGSKSLCLSSSKLWHPAQRRPSSVSPMVTCHDVNLRSVILGRVHTFSEKSR